MKSVLIAAVCALAAAAPSQQAPPATDVFLAPVGPATGLTTWMNISNSPGYDNQPSFLPDSSAILFSSNRDGKQMDIYRYDIGTKAVKQLTSTPDSEFSPTVTPDGKTFSVIRQAAADGTQLLVKYDLVTGAHQSVVFENVKPVGYHAWIDATHVALFILGAGNGAPATLQIADTKTGTAEVVATGIGRSVLVRPLAGTVSYITAGQTRTVREFDPIKKSSVDMFPAREGSQDAAWAPDGRRMWMASGTQIFEWVPSRTTFTPNVTVTIGWTEVMNLASDAGDAARPRIKGITRMAISPNGRWLAFVAEPEK